MGEISFQRRAEPMKLEDTDIIEKMIAARQAYYNGKPIMRDQEYDALEEALRQRDPNHPLLATVGHAPAGPWPKARHFIPMGSLAKVNTLADFSSFAAKFPGRRFSAQHKMDGLSLSLEYDANEFVRAVTRGGGDEGEDISDNVRLMSNFRQTLKFLGAAREFTGSVRAEVMLPRHYFDRINAILPEDDKYENTRNAAAGICRRLDGLYCKYLTLVAYDMTEKIDEDKKIERLEQLGFDVPWHTAGSADEIVLAYGNVRANRPNLHLDIDGIVVKVCSADDQESAGSVGGKPRAQVAWKFDPPGAATTFIQEEWDVGHTGVVSPVGILEPVKIAGSTIRRVTLCNVAEIKRLGIGRGDIVAVIKANDVIPKLIEVIEHKGAEIQIPTTCPRCQSVIENDGVRLFCRNDDCPGRNLHRILHWIKFAKIDQFGEAVVRELNAAGKLSRISDVYRLTAEDISSIEGWGEASAAKIMDNIKRSKCLRAEAFLSSVGIPGISDRTAEDMLKAFGDVEGALKATKEAVADLKGYSDVSAEAIVSGLAKHAQEVRELLGFITLGVEPQGGILAGLTFCFTGEMSKPRAQFQDMVTRNGGRNLTGVTKELKYLVCNENKGSSKSVKAAKLGVKVITEAEFLGMVVDTTMADPAEPASLFEEEA